MKKIFLFCWNNLIVRTLLLILITGGVLLLLTLFWLDIYTRHNKAIIVPDLHALSVEDAAALLTRQGLRYDVVDSVYTSLVPSGTIVEQIPLADSKVKASRIIFLTVNASSLRTIPLPDVQELSQRQAVAILNSVGFEADSVRYVPYQYKDLVIGVSMDGRTLATGEALPAGSKLIILVGDGNPIPEAATDSLDSIHTDDITINQEWFE